jgi:hypothetical protein
LEQSSRRGADDLYEKEAVKVLGVDGEKSAFTFTPMDLDHKTSSPSDAASMNNLTHPRSQPNSLSTDKILSHLTSITPALVGLDPFHTFAANCEETITAWVSLLKTTTLPDGIMSSDSRITAAFKAVDEIISGQCGTYLIRRLAFVEIIRLFTAVEAIIKHDRVHRRTYRESHYNDTHIAMDIYVRAQVRHSNISDSRCRHGSKRLGRRWSHLATFSPLFVLIYSDAAEKIV